MIRISSRFREASRLRFWCCGRVASVSADSSSAPRGQCRSKTTSYRNRIAAAASTRFAAAGPEKRPSPRMPALRLRPFPEDTVCRETRYNPASTPSTVARPLLRIRPPTRRPTLSSSSFFSRPAAFGLPDKSADSCNVAVAILQKTAIIFPDYTSSCLRGGQVARVAARAVVSEKHWSLNSDTPESNGGPHGRSIVPPTESNR
jgi:hypothetical protein